MIMPRWRFVGGAQQPDQLGYLEPGQVLELDDMPEVGDWEPAPGEATAAAATPQPTTTPEEG